MRAIKTAEQAAFSVANVTVNVQMRGKKATQEAKGDISSMSTH